jgi:hypothetical protein
MLQLHPDLESLVLAAKKQKTAVDPHLYVKQVEAIFSRTTNSYSSRNKMGSQIFKILDVADLFAEQKNFAGARIIYQAIASEAMSHFEELSDHEGDEISEVADACVDRIRTCLQELPENAEEREHLLHILYTIYRFDREEGGISFGEEASNVLTELATDKERQTIMHWLLQAIAENKQQKPSISYRTHWFNRFSFEVEIEDAHHFSNEALGSLLLDLQDATIDGEAYLHSCLEVGHREEAVQYLLERQRVDEAMRVASRSSDVRLPGLAECFLTFGYQTQAEQLIQNRAWKSSDPRLATWLQQHAQADPQRDETLASLLTIFPQQPTLETYQAIRRFSILSGCWRKTRTDLHTLLQTFQHFELLMQIALDEDALDESIKLLLKVDSSSQEFTMRILALAEAAESLLPEAVLHFYQGYTAFLIEKRKLASYEQACCYLLRIRTLFAQIGKPEAWERYLVRLREHYRTLKGFQNTLVASRL